MTAKLKNTIQLRRMRRTTHTPITTSVTRIITHTCLSSITFKIKFHSYSNLELCFFARKISVNQPFATSCTYTCQRKNTKNARACNASHCTCAACSPLYFFFLPPTFFGVLCDGLLAVVNILAHALIPRA